jgi:dTDP-4-dehydrorhamnose 3,5-epimerase-like enzyme
MTSPSIGPYSVIHPLASVDSDVHVGSHVFIDERASVSKAAVIGSGVHVGAGVKVGASVRVGSNATLLPDIVVAARAEVRAGAVVTRSVPPCAIVEGNPATIIGYVDASAGPRSSSMPAAPSTGRNQVEPTAVEGVTVHNFPVIVDLRGNLTVGEFERHIPFHPLRYFMVFDVPSREIRGEHAHRECHQFLICVRGSCAVVADDGKQRLEVALDTLSRGLYMPPMIWGVQYKYSPDALLLVFASHHYDPADYIRDYDEFLRLANDRR